MRKKSSLSAAEQLLNARASSITSSAAAGFAAGLPKKTIPVAIKELLSGACSRHLTLVVMAQAPTPREHRCVPATWPSSTRARKRFRPVSATTETANSR